MENTFGPRLSRYPIILTVILLLLSCVAYGQLTADFSSPITSACNSLQTSFIDQSTGVGITEWQWDINGNTSQEQNPGALFTEPGNYTICLTVIDSQGNQDQECKEDFIIVFPNPIADFTIDNGEGCTPVNVTFSDNSTSANGQISSWLWDVGGSAGVVSNAVADDVVSIYTIQGNYSASLTIIDEKGCTDTKSTSNAVKVSALRTPNVVADLQPTCTLPWSIDFTNLAADSEITYLWDFGNGESFWGQKPPTIEYTAAGVYDITIYMAAGDCRDTIILSQFVDTNSPAKFEFDQGAICQNQALTFRDISLNSADAVLWDFGDGSTSSETMPVHSYTDEGCYDVMLIRAVGVCQDTARYSCIDVMKAPTATYDITNQYACSLPAELLLHGESTGDGTFSWNFHAPFITTPYDSNDVVLTIEEYGTYYATMEFQSAEGCLITEDSIEIQIQPYEVNLPVAPIEGCAPLTFTLTDSISSQTGIVSYQWDIGNGLYVSDLASPTFTIPDTGRYDLQLIAINENGCIDTILVADYIRTGILPIVDFTATPLTGCVEEVKEFFDLSSDYADSWEWYFGVLGYSDLQNPIFSFGDPGTFDVALYASHNGCTDSLRFEDYITIFEPVSRFAIEYNCEDPYTVEIENRSIGADSLFWTLYLTETDSLIFTDSIFGQYTLPDRGNYAISHYSKSFDTGCEHIYTDSIEIVDPIASYVVDTLRGCAPFELQLSNLSQDAFTYEFVSDVADIDSIFDAEPTIIFNEGGVLNGPLLIITDIHECRDSFQLSDSVMVNKIDAIIDYDEIICIPDVANLVDLSTDELGEIISWEWIVYPTRDTFVDQNNMLTIDSVGLYGISLSIVDDWGCTDEIFVTNAITAIEVLPDFTFDTLGCTWSPIRFRSSGDNGNTVTYDWDFGDGTTSTGKNPNHTYNTEGTFSVCLTMSDVRGCGKTICKDNIIEIKNPIAAFSGDPTSAFCPPMLSTFANTSTNASTYEWNFGDDSGVSLTDSPSHVYTTPGRYDVQLIARATEFCADTLTIPEYIRLEGPIGDFLADIDSTCIPLGVELLATSDDFYSYVWDLGNGILDTVFGLVITDTLTYAYNTPGRYTPKLIITDSTGCSRSFAGDPIVVDRVDLDFTMDGAAICGPPLSISLENLSSGSTEDVDYSWLITGPEIITSEDKNPTIDVTTTGLYNVSLIANYGRCEDTITISDFMEVASIPDVSFEIDVASFCEDVNLTLNNTSSVDYGVFETWFWDFGDGTTSNLESPTHAYSGVLTQTITLTGITDKGCEASYSDTFTVLPSTVAQSGDDELICIGDDIQLQGEIINLLKGGDFYWEVDATLSCTECLNPIASPSESRSYILVAVHPNGCESRDTVHVTVIPNPGPDLALTSDPVVCLGSTGTIDILNYDSTYTYFWDTNVTGQDCYLDCPQVIISPEESATYYVTVVNEYGCIRQDSITVDVESEIEDYLVTETGVCKDELISLSVTGGINPSWRLDDSLICSNCPDISLSPASTQYYYASVLSDLGCEYTDSILVTVVPPASAYAGVDREICIGELLSLDGQGFGMPTWSTNIGMLSDDQILAPTIVPTTSGQIDLIMTYYECVQRDALNVSLYEKADIEAAGDTICVGEQATLHVEGRADDIRWIGLPSNDQNVNVSPVLTTIYEVIGSFRTCVEDTAIAQVFVHPKIDYQLEEHFYQLYLNDKIIIDPMFDHARDYAFDWSPIVGLDCSDCPDPVIEGLTASTDYQLLITDVESGCQIEEQIRVRFNNECTNSVFHLPNIFSPNMDGTNDGWRMYTNNPEEFISLHVYDRYGNFVFSTENMEEEWDGRFAGVDVVPGVYVYKIRLICLYDRKEYYVLGDVTVIR